MLRASLTKLILGLFILSCLLTGPMPVLASSTTEPPESAYIVDFRGHPQKYSLSCESRSAVDWAAFWGVEISENKFLKKLPRSDNPERGFVGNPSDPLGQIPPASYGVHAEPVAALLREFGLAAQVHKPADWELVQSEIAAGRPVIVWVIGQMWKGTPVRYTSTDGERTVVARFEHTMVVVGYSPKKIKVVDPATGYEHTYPIRDFLLSWKVLGNQAITMANTPSENPGNLEVTPTTPVDPHDREEKASKFYIVRRGDYLTGIAKKLGINWRELARLNNLKSPYIIYTGQKLVLPQAEN